MLSSTATATATVAPTMGLLPMQNMPLFIVFFIFNNYISMLFLRCISHKSLYFRYFLIFFIFCASFLSNHKITTLIKNNHSLATKTARFYKVTLSFFLKNYLQTQKVVL